MKSRLHSAWHSQNWKHYGQRPLTHSVSRVFACGEAAIFAKTGKKCVFDHALWIDIWSSNGPPRYVCVESVKSNTDAPRATGNPRLLPNFSQSTHARSQKSLGIHP